MSKKFVFCIIFVYCANQDFLSSKSVNLLFIGYEMFIVLADRLMLSQLALFR